MDLRTLLKKYMSGKTKVDDFKLLQDTIRNISDKELDSSLENLWAESEMRVMDPVIKQEVRETLQQQLHVTKRKSMFNWKNVAVAVLIPALLFSTTYLYFTSKPNVEQEFVVKSAKGQKTQIYLPDGTKVWLNSDSHISYNSNYNHDNRHISLKGEAFFDVEKNQESKFIVDVGDVTVIVHGTAFNVTAYEGDSIISVSLNRGKVSVENTNSHHIIASLSPDQQVTVNRNNFSSKLMACDAELNSLWTQNRLRLEDATTEELYKKMEHWYGVNITVSNINPNNVYSLTIKTESLREMLDLINKLTPISYTINGEEVRVTYKK